MPLLSHITQDSWAEDFQFVWLLQHRNEPEEAQIAHLEDYLMRRYSAELLVLAFSSLKYPCNWIIRNWDYLLDVGLVQENDGRRDVVNCTVLALHHIAFTNPVEALLNLNNIDLQEFVSLAQWFVDQDKRRDSQQD